MGKKDPPVDSSQTPVHAKQHVAASANKSKIIDLTFASQKAAQTLRQKSEQADAASKTEFHNKMRCMQFEQMIQKERIDCSQLTTAPPKRSGIQTQTSIQKGEYVPVKEDLSQGKKSFGGYGWIHDAKKEGRSEFFEVRYVPGSACTQEGNIPVSRLTVLTIPHHESQIALNGTRRSARVRHESLKTPQKKQGPKTHSIRKPV